MSVQRAGGDAGDVWVTAADGNTYWGRFGAAGLLAHDRSRGILLQHRVGWSHHGNTWGIPGGARHEGELAVDSALREAREEAGVPGEAVLPRFSHTVDRGQWSYTTIIAQVIAPFDAVIGDSESQALEWVPVDQVHELQLHPSFAVTWQLLRPLFTDIVSARQRLLAAGHITELADRLGDPPHNG